MIEKNATAPPNNAVLYRASYNMLLSSKELQFLEFQNVMIHG